MDRSEPPPRTDPPRRSRFGSLLRWALALVLVGIVVQLVRADPAPLLRLLELRVELLLGFLALVLINQWLMSWRLGLAVERCGGPGLPQRVWFRLTSVAQFLNLFVPQLGNIYRAVVLKREHGVAYLSYASGLFAFIWLDVVMGLGIALLVIALLQPDLALAGLPALALLALIMAAFVAAPFACAGALGRLRSGSTFVTRILTRGVRLLDTAGASLRSPGFVLRFFAINLLVTATHLAMLWLGFRAVGASPGLAVLLLFQVFVKLSNQVAITPGNLGLTELAYGLLAHATDSTLEQGIAAGLLLRAVGSAGVVLFGVSCGGGAWLVGGRKRLLDQTGSSGTRAAGFSATTK